MKAQPSEFIVSCDICYGAYGMGATAELAIEKAKGYGVQELPIVNGTLTVCPFCAEKSVQALIDWYER
jgi:hypothetical protein